MKKVLCSALVAIMLLCMTACGSSVAGHYDFESMESGGIKITAQSLKDMGAEMEMYIELEEDGTGTMANSSSSSPPFFCNNAAIFRVLLRTSGNGLEESTAIGVSTGYTCSLK